jgi:hypothetical protein
MAYSDYGAFTYCNGQRRPDKEDVGVYDTDEAAVPSGMRIFANILKNRERGTDEWWQHSQHGVMGDGPVRVACYKQGLPSGGIYFWPEGADAPECHNPQEFTDTPPLPEPAVSRKKDQAAWDAYYRSRWDYEYDHFEVEHDFGTGVYKFTFTDRDYSASEHYEATMTEPDGTRWKCVYNYGYGAGLTDEEGDHRRVRACPAKPRRSCDPG